MDELIKTVAQKANISPDVAKLAVEAVVNALKTKLPEPIAGQINGLLDGSVSPDEILKGGGGFLSGLFGKK